MFMYRDSRFPLPKNRSEVCMENLKLGANEKNLRLQTE